MTLTVIDSAPTGTRFLSTVPTGEYFDDDDDDVDDDDYG